jgi:hypothetical protein
MDIISLEMIIEKRGRFSLQTHLAFISYEKAFDRVNNLKLWKVPMKRGYLEHLQQAAMNLHNKMLINIHIRGYQSIGCD